MKPAKITIGLLVVLTTFMGCQDFLEREIVSEYKEDEVFVNYERMSQAGYGVYTFLFYRFGFHRIDNAMLAAACDEADNADINSNVQKFNNGSWNAASNPENYWDDFYQGIRSANLFLEKSEDYKNIVYIGDTLHPSNKSAYEYNVRDIAWLRAEVRFLRAFYYFELIKRYGGVPILTKSTHTLEELKGMSRSTFAECVDFVVKECDSIVPLLKDTWIGFDDDKWRGRVTKGAAMALKARVLLYAASPLHNPANDIKKWEAAAEAAHDVIALNQYALHNDYKGLFRIGNGSGNPEVIFAQHGWNRNDFEKMNYPIGYEQGGQGSTCPSQNLVNAYNMQATGLPIGEPGSGYDPENPYEGRDPRLKMSILTNNEMFKGRPVESWVGGLDGFGKPKATTTGYYMRKFVDENLNLAQNNSSLHTWILFRYAEVLLNFAEAMNEAYGPEAKNGYTMSAKTAIDMIRARPGVDMPILPPGLSQDEMRERIRNERRVELAFEEHRFFDVRRWKIAEETGNMPIMAMKITRNEDGSFNHVVVKAEDRVFEERMYFYPIPEWEILKSNGALVQNEGW